MAFGILFWSVVALLFSAIQSYKPVIIMHGILDKAVDMEDLANLIKSAHPGTNITVIDMFPEVRSFEPLWKQVKEISEKILPIMVEAKNGVHLIGFSQGGLTLRGILETMPDHNVDTFIALSSPLMGQYGDTSYLKPYFPKGRKDAYELLYTCFAQATFSLANYWNDPFHEELNLKYDVFLPFLNNNQSSSKRNDSAYKAHKKNFSKIKNLVLIGGPDDGVITPWQSSQFGFYMSNDESLHVADMRQQTVYLEDSFGLKTLDRRGSIHMYTFSGVKHIHWHGNKTVFNKAIEPWLI